MTLAAWIALVNGVLKFPGELLAVVKFLEKTPEEQRQDAMKRVTGTMDDFEKTGRPTWD